MSGGEKTVTIRLTKAELWELQENFNASFTTQDTGAFGEDFGNDNSLAEAISQKLAVAYKKVSA